MQTMIFGAQGYARGAYKALKALYPDNEVHFFMVTSAEGNPSSLCGLPVREIASVSAEMSEDEKKNTRVLIATPENVQPQIGHTLEEFGFTDHLALTSERWDDMMGKLYGVTGEFSPLRDMAPGEKVPAINVYMARSHKDKPLSVPFTLPGYMTPIQAGAANTEEVIADVRDDTGDNISARNGNYCELTGLYWVWKNVLCRNDDGGGENDLYGFAQYRRILMLSEEDLRRIARNDIDAVLPYPLSYEPDINEHHKRYLKENDWNALLSALEELHPEYAADYGRILGQEYMFNYNVILAKKHVLRDYCEWVFPVLERTGELSVPKGCDRSDRYIGYMGETLETLYFLKNRDKLNIAFTGCRLLV